MFTKTLFCAVTATLVLIAAAPAQAQEVDTSPAMAQQSTRTRAEVRQAAVQARAAGLINDGESYRVPERFIVVKSRAEVHAETLEAIRLGAISHGELSYVLSDMQLMDIEKAGKRARAMTLALR
jgi:hypothetical protein